MHICPGTLLHKGPIANACVAKGPKAEEEELLHNGDITHKTLFIQNGIPLNENCHIGYSRRNLVMPIFVKTMLLLQFQSSDRDQMEDMKILHSMVHLDF